MTDIAFHITDLAANSLRAGADAIDIALSLDGTQLELAVTDNGCGMAPEAVRRAFDPFYTTRTTRRTGLGLPFLLQSAEGCGGSAAIRSVPGKGTAMPAGHTPGNTTRRTAYPERCCPGHKRTGTK